jgi:two-component system chemotaxis sensor kinase CheA
MPAETVMQLDLSQFHQVFFDETAEHLSTMELLLLHLDPQDPDPALLEDIGRAAHSIKGSGATFGFRDMARLAEEAQALIEGVRRGRTRPSAALVDALREACAALKAQLAEYRGEGAAAAQAAARAAALLRSFSAERAAGAPPAAAAPEAKVSPQETATEDLAGAAMALVGAAAGGGLREATEAVRALGEAIEQNAALAQHAVDNAEALRETFRALVREIAGLALASPGRRPAARPRPLPKVRRSGAAGSDKEWPEF